jgi:hypothetical protein
MYFYLESSNNSSVTNISISEIYIIKSLLKVNVLYTSWHTEHSGHNNPHKYFMDT